MLFRLIGRIVLPLSSQQLAETLIDEVNFGISDGCLLLSKIQEREVFNYVYEEEILEIYKNKTIFDFIHTTLNLKCIPQKSMTDYDDDDLHTNFACLDNFSKN